MTDLSREALDTAIKLAETPLRVKPLIEIARALRDRVDELEALAGRFLAVYFLRSGKMSRRHRHRRLERIEDRDRRLDELEKEQARLHGVLNEKVDKALELEAEIVRLKMHSFFATPESPPPPSRNSSSCTRER